MEVELLPHCTGWRIRPHAQETVTTAVQAATSSQLAGAWHGCVQGWRRGKLSRNSVIKFKCCGGEGATHHNLLGFPQGAVHFPHPPSPPSSSSVPGKWHNRSQRWPPHAMILPHTLPHPTRSAAQRTFPTSFFPHMHRFVVRNGHGGHGISSGWHMCCVRGCPHGGGGRGHW